jgi:hypothetical protein
MIWFGPYHAGSGMRIQQCPPYLSSRRTQIARSVWTEITETSEINLNLWEADPEVLEDFLLREIDELSDLPDDMGTDYGEIDPEKE